MERAPCPSCATCGLQQAVLKRCVRCRSIFYCSRACQIKDWNIHQLQCGKRNKLDSDFKTRNTDFESGRIVDETSKTILNIKCNHKKHKVTLKNAESSPGDILMQDISKQLRIPLESLKLIEKGKIVNQSNVRDMVLNQKCKSFQAIGEEAEAEDGLDAGDIEAIMEELHVCRNKAIRSLRSCNGDLIDAILELGNKL